MIQRASTMLGGDAPPYYCPATPDQHTIAALRLERDTLKRELAGVKESFTVARARVKELEEARKRE